jgi:FkbM family methyltransferase
MKTRNIEIGGDIYSISSDDNYIEAIGNNFEPSMVDLFRALISPNDIVADIGANIGMTAILFSKLAQKVIAFEPSPTTFNILNTNISTSRANNVTTENIGLGQKDATTSITFSKNNRSGAFVSEVTNLETGHITEEINIKTLDHFFPDNGITPSFLKIDVEGFEKNVIEGGRRLLERCRPTVVMEMNHFCLDVLQRITVPDFLDFMRSVFPFLYAVDSDNCAIADLHIPEVAYMVMHEHVVRQRFPNIVGSFESATKNKLDTLAGQALELRLKVNIATPIVTTPKGSIRINTHPNAVAAGDTLKIPVTLDNTGDESWHGYGNHPVKISYHWKKTDGTDFIFEGIRTELKSKIIPPHKTATEIADILAPSRAGEFILIITLLQEGVCWFEDKGFEFDSFFVAVL